MEEENNKEKKMTPRWREHLSTAFVVVGIVSFVLGATVNYLTIKRIRKNS